MEESNPIAATRRRRHNAEFKAEAIKACMQAGVSIAAVTLHYRLNANMLRTWVSAHERAAAEPVPTTVSAPTAEFVPLQLAGTHETAAIPDIVIEIKRGGAMTTIRALSQPASQISDLFPQRWAPVR